MDLNMLTAKCWPFCLCLNELITHYWRQKNLTNKSLDEVKLDNDNSGLDNDDWSLNLIFSSYKNKYILHCYFFMEEITLRIIAIAIQI